MMEHSRSSTALNSTVSYLVMKKLCLIFFGFLAMAAVISAWDNEDSSLSEEMASSHLRKGKSVVLEGEHCQYIDFANARSSGSGCVDGTKMVIKNK